MFAIKDYCSTLRWRFCHFPNLWCDSLLAVQSKQWMLTTEISYYWLCNIINWHLSIGVCFVLKLRLKWPELYSMLLSLILHRNKYIMRIFWEAWLDFSRLILKGIQLPKMHENRQLLISILQLYGCPYVWISIIQLWWAWNSLIVCNYWYP